MRRKRSGNQFYFGKSKKLSRSTLTGVFWGIGHTSTLFIVGMLTFTTIIGIPFVYSKKNVLINRSLAQVAGTVSFLFGIYYMYNLGINEGLFKLWVQ
ncbi:hypothetical protein [Paenibacillus dendrobii]|uniref:hypothetical protein n=1 Tax=Paenibacillus dendrobii TaxID=2691084 RepID=UPI0019240B85